MAYSWLLVPFIAAFAGWLCNRLVIRLLFRPYSPKRILGLTIQGILPKRKEAIAGQIARAANAELLSFNDIAGQIGQPQHLEKLMPAIEEHVDRFLRVKLPEQMPMISMFIGDKTIAQLKEIFINELKILFPQVMGDYARQLQGEMNLEKLITEKLLSISPRRMEQLIRSGLAAELAFFGQIGAGLGFVTGWIAVLLMMFVGT
jgi:uncharacterized membrane protein YheB (UPF0754 family)